MKSLGVVILGVFGIFFGSASSACSKENISRYSPDALVDFVRSQIVAPPQERVCRVDSGRLDDELLALFTSSERLVVVDYSRWSRSDYVYHIISLDVGAKDTLVVLAVNERGRFCEDIRLNGLARE